MWGEEVLSGVINGFFARHQIEKWAGLIMTMTTSAICTFLSVGGGGIIAHLSAGSRPAVAVAYGLGEGSVTAAAMIFLLWAKSPLTKGLTITVPREVEQKATEVLQQQGTITQPGGQK